MKPNHTSTRKQASSAKRLPKSPKAPVSKPPASSRASSLTRRQETSRDRILDAAAAVLAKRGFVGTTVGEIAQIAGSQSGSLYYHFESREAIIEAVLRRGATYTFEHVRTAVAALPDDATARERLSTALFEHVRFQWEVSDYARAVTRSNGQIPPDLQRIVNKEFKNYGIFMDQLFADAVNEGHLDAELDRSAMRMLILGSANYTLEWYKPGGRVNVKDLADLVVQLLFEGYGARPATRRVTPPRRR